jgi:hypothetical protein
MRIRDPGIFLTLDPGSGSGMNIPDHISESSETIFWVKILKFFDADADPGSGNFLTLDPGSGMGKIRISKTVGVYSIENCPVSTLEF